MTSQNFTASFTVEHSAEEVFKAITNVRGWWTGDIDGNADTPGAEFTYRYAVDRTATAMGGRMLRRWLHRPLRDRDVLRLRYNAVATLMSTEYTAVAETLKSIGDLERIIARIALRSARPRDLTQLRTALAALPRLHHILAATTSPVE